MPNPFSSFINAIHKKLTGKKKYEEAARNIMGDEKKPSPWSWLKSKPLFVRVNPLAFYQTKYGRKSTKGPTWKKATAKGHGRGAFNVPTVPQGYSSSN